MIPEDNGRSRESRPTVLLPFAVPATRSCWQRTTQYRHLGDKVSTIPKAHACRLVGAAAPGTQARDISDSAIRRAGDQVSELRESVPACMSGRPGLGAYGVAA